MDSKTVAAIRLATTANSPNLCFVNPKMVNGVLPAGLNVEIRTTRSVLPNHLWMGIRS